MRRSFLPKEAWKLVARVWWFGRASSGSIRVYPHKPATLLCRQIPKGTPPMFPERVHPIFHSSLDIIPFLSGESRAQTDDRQRYQAGTTSYNYTILRVDFGSNRYIYIYIVQLCVGYVTSMAFPCAVVSTVQSKGSP